MALADRTATLSEQDLASQMSACAACWGLVIAWSAEEPERVGEVAPVPGGSAGPYRIFGRGEPGPSDPHGRLLFAQVRGCHVQTRPPLSSPRLSRVQLRVRALGDESVEVENVGRLALQHNDLTVTRALARPGDTLQLGNQWLLLVVRRTYPLPGGAPASAPAFPFGCPDANGIVGESPAAWALRDRIAFVGPRTGHVLVHGASGVGKELVARAVHAASSRARRPIVSRNAATLPEGIVDAELFGNTRNYPNVGALERPGLVGAADGTTLFLDEFGELPRAVQVHLLRLLDEGEYQRLGDARISRSDLRMIAATNRSPSVLKEDVLARLTFRIEVPDLNARREDVPLLAHHLLRRILSRDTELAASRAESADREVPTLSVAVVRNLLARDYTTHARELEGLLWRTLEGSHGPLETDRDEQDSPGSRDVPSETRRLAAARSGRPGAPTVEDVQRSLDAHNGVIEDAWRDLGLSSRHALTRLIRKHAIEIRKRPRA
jgi:two-component system nitrogen regulation response regulator GlnG/two-component system response regulator HydG